MDGKLIATDVIAASSRSGWAPGIDLRMIADTVHGVFAIGDGFGPTYGGHYYPLALDPALDAALDALGVSDAPGLEHAFVRAQRVAHDLSRGFEAARGPKHGLGGQRDAALSVRPDLASVTSEFFHAAVGISLVRLRSATLEVGQVGMSRVYVSHEGEITLCVLDHSLSSEMLRKYGAASHEYESVVDHHRRVVTRMLGITAECAADYATASVADSDDVLLCSAGVWNQPCGAQLVSALFAAEASSFAEVLAGAGASSRIDAAAIRFRVRHVSASPPWTTSPTEGRRS